MSHYSYLEHNTDDYDANRKGVITDEQLMQMQAKLMDENQINRRGFLLLWGASSALVVVQWWELALPFLLGSIFVSLVYPRLTRRRLNNLNTVNLQRIEGRIRLMNTQTRKDDDPMFVQLKHIEIDFNFDIPAGSPDTFIENETYRFYYVESPNFVLSVQVIDPLDKYHERKAYETL